MTQPKNPLVFDEKAAEIEHDLFWAKTKGCHGHTLFIHAAKWQHSKDTILLESALKIIGEMEASLKFYEGDSVDTDLGDYYAADKALEKLSLWKKEMGI